MCVYEGSGAGLSRGLEDWACLFTTVFGCFTGRAGAKHHCVFKKRHRRPIAHREKEREKGRERGREIQPNIKTCYRIGRQTDVDFHFRVLLVCPFFSYIPSK